MAEEVIARILHVRCYIRYSGRIDAELEVGDRIILILADGAAVVHAVDGGVKPKNWMPTGTDWIEVPGELLIGEHARRDEKLEVYIEKVYMDQKCHSFMNGKLVKLGSEYEVSNWISENPEIVDASYRTVAREYRTAVGPIDILMIDDEDNPVIIEVKRIRVVGGEVAYQLLRYRDALINSGEWRNKEIKCVLIAPGLSASAKILLTQHNITYKKLRYTADKKELSD